MQESSIRRCVAASALLLGAAAFRLGRQQQGRGQHSDVGERPKQQHAAAANHQNPAAGQSGEWPALNSNSIEPEIEEVEHRVVERRFWERQIRVAKWLNWITGVGTVVAIIGLIILYFTLKGADEATVDANRAWITPYAPAIPWPRKPIQMGDKFSLSIPYIDAGKSPAFDIAEYHEQFGLTVEGKKTPLTVESLTPKPNDTCDKIGSPSSGQTGIVWPFIPGITNAQFFGPATKDKFTVDVRFISGKELLGLHGCYRYTTFKQIHHSQYCYILVPIYDLAGNMLGPDQWGWRDCPGENQNYAD